MGETASFSEKSFGAVGITLVSVFSIGWLCKAADLPTEVTGAATSVALMVPAALAQRGQKRQAEQDARTAGDTRHAAVAAHPSVSPLHALILGGAIVLLDSILGIVVALLGSDLGGLAVLALELAIVFLAMGRLVDWLGPKPYLTVTAAVGVTLVVRVFLMLLASDALEELGMGGGAVFVVVLVTHALILVAALAGLWRARRKVGAGAATVPLEAPAPVVHTFSWPVEPDPLRATPAEAVSSPPPTQLAPPAPPAGWYADPDLRGIERWWDGSAWSDKRRNKPS